MLIDKVLITIKNLKSNFTKPSRVFIFLLFIVIGLFTFQITNKNHHISLQSIFSGAGVFGSEDGGGGGGKSCSGFFQVSFGRKVVMKSIAEFGGTGDGKTSNTAAFKKAMEYMESLKEKGGGTQLNVPRGIWLTGSFNLSSNFTLFLEHGAVILGSQDPKEWPIINPLPSYGRGRERPGGRHISLIHGSNLTNVVITGHNGTIDGQGKMWWELWWNRTLEHTRGHLVELIHSNNILISNLTFRNSPFWTIHPVYCRI